MSAIFAGKVHHARLRPKRHRLAYRVFMVLVDVDGRDEPIKPRHPRGRDSGSRGPSSSRRLSCVSPAISTRAAGSPGSLFERPEDDERKGAFRFYSRNRFNLLSVHDRDHGDGSGGALRPQVEARIVAAGLPVPGGRIEMLTMPRILGRAFNPLTVFYCRDPDGGLAVIVYQVNNTFGARHFYVLPASEREGRIQQGCDKAFFVSPFMEMDLSYAFDVVPPTGVASIGIRVSDEAGAVLNASFTGVRRPMSDGAILAAWIGHPVQTIGVLVAIYWQGFKLLLKGLRWRSPKTAKAPQVLLHGPSTVTAP